ncbi:hypothetical protein CgunFtcFv8_001037 [Champsocephalus gunnari]|uniref:Uncharacterized protein n=1 Tax=Champsocephalus gunnari TaxID=52237 RepID=A0AAN8DPZ9_CHAGU|nr:hypothetical protein CgunFtcFv8_001037 [Champsocephalus gunnari]
MRRLRERKVRVKKERTWLVRRDREGGHHPLSQQPVSIRGNQQPVSIRGNQQPVSIQGNQQPVSIRGNQQPVKQIYYNN